MALFSWQYLFPLCHQEMLVQRGPDWEGARGGERRRRVSTRSCWGGKEAVCIVIECSQDGGGGGHGSEMHKVHACMRVQLNERKTFS